MGGIFSQIDERLQFTAVTKPPTPPPWVTKEHAVFNPATRCVDPPRVSDTTKDTKEARSEYGHGPKDGKF